MLLLLSCLLPNIIKMDSSIIQWNCRGIGTSHEELSVLIAELNPSLICLQETFLKNNKLTYQGYQSYNYIHNSGSRASGGVSILIRNNIPQSEIPLDTNLQAVAVRATLHRTFSICSIYIPPNEQLSETAIEKIINKLPKPFILLGDFNSHNILWGSQKTDLKGNQMEKIINKNNLCLFNKKDPTHINLANGSQSAIDLSLCDPTSLLDFSWEVYNDLCGSDHYPIVLKNEKNTNFNQPARWKLKKAKWDEFQTLCSISLTQDYIDNAEEFTKTIISIAEKCIPKNSTPNKKNKPWFNNECKEAINKRKAALRKFKKEPTTSNLTNYKLYKAKARKTLKEAKKTCWREYVNGINISTKPKAVWRMIKGIAGKNNSAPIKHLSSDGIKITDKKDIAGKLAENFSENSSSKNYKKQFQTIKRNAEKCKLKFNSNNSEEYNLPFSLVELKNSIQKSHNTAVGPDEIHYEFIKNLPEESLNLLLKIFNDIWIKGIFPETWKQATVIPIPKQGKDDTDPTNYRPISLTSCLCKTLERMINQRLVWHLESNNILTNMQSGYRKNRGCIDHLINLETFVREAFIKKEHAVSVFFDLEKAYDTTWKYGIIRDLHEIGLRGRMPKFITNFLSDRTFKVRIGSTSSDTCKQEEGVPQGSILSTTLFNIKINNLAKQLSNDMNGALYVDDCTIGYRAKYMQTVERKLQNCINKINKWATENGFKFSKTKTKCLHFCNQRQLHPDPILKLEGNAIPVIDQYKYLGLIFDRKLTFIPHINYIKKKCNKALQLLRVIAHTKWGADKETLLKLYRALIRSKIDYGSFIYQSARKSYLKILNPIYHTGLRLALGAFRTSPVESLYTEANETPPKLRCNKLALMYYTKLKSNKKNPAYNNTFHPKYRDLFLQKEKAIKPFGLRMEELTKEANLPIEKIQDSYLPEIAPWTITTPEVDISLSVLNKQNTHPLIFQEKFEEIREKYNQFNHIYTDGSKQEETTSCAAIYGRKIKKKRLPKVTSIFNAELCAINLALDLASEEKSERFVIMSDSLSVLKAMKNQKMDNPLLTKLLIKLHELSKRKKIELCWIPSHIGIKGNEMADLAAKSAQTLNIDTHFRVPYTDLKVKTKEYINQKWQNFWDKYPNNKLHKVKPIIGYWNMCPVKLNRNEEVILTRLHIGHTKLTHSYLLLGEEQPECIPCQTPLTVKHILTECIDYLPIRTSYYKTNDMKKLFKKTSALNIIHYLKKIGIYDKL